MTEAQRYTAITKLIESYTKKHTVSQTAARNALIREGIYTKNGRLKAKFREEIVQDQAAV